MTNPATSQQPETREYPPDSAVVTDENAPAKTVDDTQAAESGEDSQTTTESAPADSDNLEPQKKRRDRGVERRMKKFTKKLAQAEAAKLESDKLIQEQQEELERLRAKVPAPDKPKLGDFEDEDKFVEAYQAWNEDSKPAPKPRPAPKQPDGPTTEEIAEFRERGIKAGGDKFLAAHQNKEIAVSPTMGEYILESELGPEVYVYLSEHIEESKEIADETTVESVIRLQAIEAKVAAAKKKGAPIEPAKKKTGKSTKAPPPGPVEEPGVAIPEKDLSKASMDDYAASRLAKQRKFGR